MRPIRSSLIFIAFSISALGTAQPQTLNDGFAAMEQGDFFTAFSALRQLERAGDPQATRMLNEIFLSPGSQPTAVAMPERSAPVQPANTNVRAPVHFAPERSLRPQARLQTVALAVPPRSSTEPIRHDLPRPLGDASFRALDEQLAEIGHLLFFDPILSGNKDISCAVCHHPRLASGDGVSLGLGTGASGLGQDRRPDGERAASRRIPRNAPPLWNLGAHDIRTLFHDGRVEGDPDDPSARLTPHGPLDYMELHSLLAVQALFPVLSHEEMAGRPGENPVADAVHEHRLHGDDGAWAILAKRVDAIPAYRAALAAWRGQDRPVQMEDIANAIAAFIEAEFRADQTPFDQYLREVAAISSQAGEGMRLFYGKANCASCHSGTLLSDQNFHAMGQPPIGPGKEKVDDGYTRDIGRAAVTLDEADNFAFRTPMLRNVMQSGPWGHAGAFSDIRAFLRHHLDPVAGLVTYEPQAILPALETENDDYAAAQNAKLLAYISRAAARSMAQRPLVVLQDDEIDLLVAFLEALTDPIALEGKRGIPAAVPSGLPIER